MNRRTDRWGGDCDSRTAYLRAVIDHVRAVVSSDFIVGLHLISDELADGGWTVAESCWLAPIVAAAGIDFIMPVVATFETMRLPHNVGMLDRPLFQHAQTAAIKRVSPVPVFSNGGIHDPELAERLLADGEADAIGLARPLFADPDWVAKIRAGRDADLRLCACDPPTCLRTQLTGSVCESWPDTAKAQGWLGYAA
jgi:2,4-dienoyl-CoA reductase (NADPH2)